MSSKDYHAIRVVFIIIVLWMGVWNLLEEVLEKIEEKTGLESWKLYLALVFIAVVFIIIDPYTFEKL